VLGLLAEAQAVQRVVHRGRTIARDAREGERGRARRGRLRNAGGREPSASAEPSGKNRPPNRQPAGRGLLPRLTITFFEPVWTTGRGSAKRRTQARPALKGWALS